LTTIPQVELVPISDLTVDGENPNRMSERQRDALSTSMDRYGFIIPIITNKDLLIADGEQRWEVAKSRHMTEVPVVRLDVEDVDRRLLRQVLNKLKGQHHEELDAQEFLRIVEAGERKSLQQLVDLSDKEIQRHLDLIRDPKPEDYDMPALELMETNIQRGDVYQLNNHRLMCGDATKDISTLMENTQVDMLFTDPPYGKLVEKGRLINKGKYGSGGFTKFKTGKSKWVDSTYYVPIEGNTEDFNPSSLLSLADTIILFGGNYYSSQLPDSRCWFVWDKGSEIQQTQFADCELIWTNMDKVARIYKCLWRGLLKEGESGKRLHPAQKPIKLLSEIIKDFTHNSDIILDPYGGSGSTLIACEQTGRTCYMMEIDPRYCQIIIDRWEAYTGRTAELVKE
jgi:DNA modification methylase